MSMKEVVGIMEPTDTWLKMKAVWDACDGAGIPVPTTVNDYFRNLPPRDNGLRVDLRSHECCTVCQEHSRTGFKIDLSKLPEGVKYLQFYDQW